MNLPDKFEATYKDHGLLLFELFIRSIVCRGRIEMIRVYDIYANEWSDRIGSLQEKTIIKKIKSGEIIIKDFNMNDNIIQNKKEIEVYLL